jgi:hypothetical protein
MKVIPDRGWDAAGVGAERLLCAPVGCNMTAILPYLRDAAFEPKDITAMSMALDDICKALNILDGSPAREVIAERIIALAATGERSPTLLRDRVMQEAGLANQSVATDWNETKRPSHWSGL